MKDRIQKLVQQANISLGAVATKRNTLLGDVKARLLPVYKNEELSYYTAGSYKRALGGEYDNIANAQNLYNLGVSNVYTLLYKDVEALVQEERAKNSISLSERIALVELAENTNISIDSKLEILSTVSELGSVDSCLEKMISKLDMETGEEYTANLHKLEKKRAEIAEATGANYLTEIKQLIEAQEKVYTRDIDVTRIEDSLYYHTNKIALTDSGLIADIAPAQSWSLGVDTNTTSSNPPLGLVAKVVDKSHSYGEGV